MISVFKNSFQNWIRNISVNVVTVIIFRNIEISFYVREKSIHDIGCLTTIVNNFIIFC